MDYRRVGIVSAIALVMAACGGGGGGDTPAPQPTAPPPAPNAPASFQFSATNATDAAGFVLQTLEHVSLVAQYPAIVADILRLGVGTERTHGCGSVQLRFSYADQDASGHISPGDVLRFVSPGCGNYAADVTLTLTGIELIPLGSPYVGVGSGVQRLAGLATFDIVYTPSVAAATSTGAGQGAAAKPSDPAGDLALLGTLLAPFPVFDEAPSLSAPAATRQHARGTFALDYSATATMRRWLVTDLAATLASGNTVESLSSGRLERSVTGNAYLLDLSGTIDSQRLATRYTFRTPALLQGVSGAFPTAGVLELVSGASRLALGPSPDPMRGSVAIDATGGGYGAAQSIAWTEFLLGNLFGWAPNEPPVITQLSISPDEPTGESTLTADYVATDPDDQPLQHTFQWRRNGEILPNQPFATLSPFGARRGDVVEVTLTVSDGRVTASRTAQTTIRNAAPRLGGLALVPSSPTTVDDLSLAGQAFDPDDDPLVVSYRWQRNGQDIAGRAGPTLPASETSRSDVITLIVTASDGAVTTTGQASVTIADSPPTFTVTGAPTSVVRSSPVQFTATLMDPDGDATDSLRFALTHGPAGMTIDPVSGRVDWIAELPMFDRAQRVSWGVTVDVPGVSPLEGTITVTDATREYPLMRTGIEIPLQRAGLRIGDFDADGDNEMLILSYRSLYELEATGSGYRQSWMYPFALPVSGDQSYLSDRAFAMTTGDIDGDERHEIFVAVARQIVMLDGVARRVVRSVPLAQMDTCRDLELANLDGVGPQELVCIAGSTSSYDAGVLAVFGADDLVLRWQTALPGQLNGGAVALGNVDGDAALEIVTSNGAVYDGVTQTNQWLYGPGFGIDVDTGDLDGDGVEEIVGAVDWVAVRGYSATLRSPIWEVQASDLDALLVTDIDGDGRSEILAGDGQWGEVTAYRYNPVTNSADVVFQIDSQDHGVTDLQAGDVDNDGQLEFVWGSGASSSGADRLVVAGRNPAIVVEWTNTNPQQLDGPFGGGQLAGSPLVARGPLFVTGSSDSGYRGTRLIRMNAANGDLSVTAELGSNFNGTATLAVVDYDNDGLDEAFLGTSQQYNGYLTVYDTFNQVAEWTGPQAQGQSGAAAIASADLTNDGREELVAISWSGVVSIHDVFQQTLVWQSTTLGAGLDIVVADLDRDGSLDLLVVTNSRLYVYERVGGAIGYAQTASYQPPYGVRDAIVVDTDGDGELEIVVLTASYEQGRIDRLDPGLQPLGHAWVGQVGDLLEAELSSGPSRNVMVASADSSGYRSALAAIDARSGEEVWRSPWLAGRITRNSAQRVAVSGADRFTIGTSSGMYLTR